MSTDALIEQLLDTPGDATVSALDALHDLLDDSTLGAAAPPLRIAEAAEFVKSTPHTLRYYEQEGLVTPQRDASGHRQYSPVHLRRLVFLTRMRVSGMSMTELRRYIALVDRGADTMPERRRMMLDQRGRIQRRLRELTLALETTDFKIRSYDGAP